MKLRVYYGSFECCVGSSFGTKEQVFSVFVSICRALQKYHFQLNSVMS